MPRRKRRGRWSPLVVAMAVMAVLGLLTALGAVVSVVKWIRLTRAVSETADTKIGATPTVATILATRDAIRETAKEQGAPRAVVFAVIERRTTDDGQPCHVACFYLCARYCHPEFERALPGILTPVELERLRDERIHEHTGSGQRWKHHHH